MPSGVPDWAGVMAVIGSFLALDLVHGFLQFVIGLAAAALFVSLLKWALTRGG